MTHRWGDGKIKEVLINPESENMAMNNKKRIELGLWRVGHRAVAYAPRPGQPEARFVGGPAQKQEGIGRPPDGARAERPLAPAGQAVQPLAPGSAW